MLYQPVSCHQRRQNEHIPWLPTPAPSLQSHTRQPLATPVSSGQHPQCRLLSCSDAPRCCTVTPALVDRSEGFPHRAAPPQRRTKRRFLHFFIFSFFHVFFHFFIFSFYFIFSFFVFVPFFHVSSFFHVFHFVHFISLLFFIFHVFHFFFFFFSFFVIFLFFSSLSPHPPPPQTSLLPTQILILRHESG